MHPDALAVAREIAAERGARIVQADGGPATRSVGALGTFQRRNFALARAAARGLLSVSSDRRRGRPGGRCRGARAGTAADRRPRPLTLLDGAHNPDGIVALAESLPEIIAGARAGEGRVVAVLSILDDKDALAMLRSLAPLLTCWC